jgi:hypothetical protein
MATTQYKKNEDGQYVCPSCPYTARIQSTMHYHLKKHEDTLPYSCTHCDKQFAQKSVLDLHVSARHKEPGTKASETFKCPCCTYEDVRKGNRMIHFLRVHLKDCTDALKETPPKETKASASCKGCSKTFKSMTQFYYHAASCVKPLETHANYKAWLELKKS